MWAEMIFRHEGFAKTDEVYHQIRENWSYYLTSLKDYLETGNGTPGLPPSALYLTREER
jgi:hypothetical protein